MKRLTGICIITRDVPRLCEFYRKALQIEPVREGDLLATFAMPGAELSLFNEESMEPFAPGSMQGAGHGSYTLDFQVENVDAEHARLTRLNIPIVKPPQTHPWGRRSLWFRDPDGNLVNFYANTAQPPSTQALVREYFQRLLNERDLTVCDERLARDYVDHDAPPSTPPGPESSKQFVAGFLAEYPDLHIEILDTVAEGRQAAVRLIWDGHHAETGARFHQMGIVLLRLNDQKQFVERWSAYQSLE